MEEILKIINEMIDNYDKRFIESSVYNHYADGARNALQELKAKVSRIELPVKPATCEHCKDCKHFEYSENYNNVGDCNHPKFNEGIIFQYCDDMYVSEDFGCINYESKLSV
jgi:hypothetical protein